MRPALPGKTRNGHDIASVPYLYTVGTNFIWDRDLGFRENAITYWLLVWAIWPTFGAVQAAYCFARLL